MFVLDIPKGGMLLYPLRVSNYLKEKPMRPHSAGTANDVSVHDF